MAFEDRRHGEADRDNPVLTWKRKMARIQRRLRLAEGSLEQAQSDLDQLVDEVESGSTLVPTVDKTRGREPRPLPVATGFNVPSPHTVTFVVHGVEFRVELNRSQLELLVQLKMPTKEGPDHLVGFKTIGALVHALRLRGLDATRRSVTVEVSRLRMALGTNNRHLVESRRNVGYRFRLVRSAALGVRTSS